MEDSFLSERVENILIKSLTIFTLISCIYNSNKVCVYKLLIPFKCDYLDPASVELCSYKGDYIGIENLS